MEYIPRKLGYNKYFVLQTDDLVYIPEKDENIDLIDWTNKKKLQNVFIKL